MAKLVDLLNAGICSVSNILGTNNDYCKVDMQRPSELWRFPFNYKFPADFEWTYENIKSIQEAGDLIWIGTIKNFTDETPDDSLLTDNKGNESVSLKAPVKWNLKLETGVQGFQAMNSLSKAQYHSFVVIDDANQAFMYKGSDNISAPLKCEFFNAQKYKPVGDEAAGFMVNMQLDRRQFDTGLHAISEENGFDPDLIVGIVDLTSTIVAPADTNTSFDFSVIRRTDKHSFDQNGLEAMTGWVVKVNGVVVAGAVTAITGGYRFTRTVGTFAVGEVISIELPIEFLNDVPYRVFKTDVVVLP